MLCIYSWGLALHCGFTCYNDFGYGYNLVFVSFFVLDPSSYVKFPFVPDQWLASIVIVNYQDTQQVSSNMTIQVSQVSYSTCQLSAKFYSSTL